MNMKWEYDLLELADAIGIDNLIPIAHTRIRLSFAVLLAGDGSVISAKKTNCKVTIPCTIDSECRTNGVSPHLTHDNLSYIGALKGFEDRHEAYLSQLQKYVDETHDSEAAAIWNCAERGTIIDDLKELIPDFDESNCKSCNIGFHVYGRSTDTINRRWIDYYLSSLPINGMCSITGEMDHIPSKYPARIRNGRDFAKLWSLGEADVCNFMPKLLPGYKASQRILHTLQFMCYEGKEMALSLGYGDLNKKSKKEAE